MHRDFVLCIVAIALAIGGWVGGKKYDQFQARKFARDQAAAAVVAQQQAEVEKSRLLQAVQAKQKEDRKAAAVVTQQALVAERKLVETELGACKLSSIMLGSPSIAIINKKGYESGGELHLPSGKTLSVTSIQPDAVLLSDGRQGYRLALPAAQDVGSAMR